MIIFLYIIIISSCSYIGFGIADYYIKREKIFFEMSRFCEKLKADISFLLMPLEEILETAQEEYNTPVMTEMINICKNYIKQGTSLNSKLLQTSFKSRYIVTEEKTLICNFFSMLGKSDEKTQIENIQNYNLRFKNAENICQKERKKYSPMSKKLGFLFGITICLFML